MEITREQHYTMYATIAMTLKETTSGLEDNEIFDLADELLENICNALNITIKNGSPKELLDFIMSQLT